MIPFSRKEEFYEVVMRTELDELSECLVDLVFDETEMDFEDQVHEMWLHRRCTVDSGCVVPHPPDERSFEEHLQAADETDFQEYAERTLASRLSDFVVNPPTYPANLYDDYTSDFKNEGYETDTSQIGEDEYRELKFENHVGEDEKASEVTEQTQWDRVSEQIKTDKKHVKEFVKEYDSNLSESAKARHEELRQLWDQSEGTQKAKPKECEQKDLCKVFFGGLWWIVTLGWIRDPIRRAFRHEVKIVKQEITTEISDFKSTILGIPKRMLSEYSSTITVVASILVFLTGMLVVKKRHDKKKKKKAMELHTLANEFESNPFAMMDLIKLVDLPDLFVTLAMVSSIFKILSVGGLGSDLAYKLAFLRRLNFMDHRYIKPAAVLTGLILVYMAWKLYNEDESEARDENRVVEEKSIVEVESKMAEHVDEKIVQQVEAVKDPCVKSELRETVAELEYQERCDKLAKRLDELSGELNAKMRENEQKYNERMLAIDTQHELETQRLKEENEVLRKANEKYRDELKSTYETKKPKVTFQEHGNKHEWLWYDGVDAEENVLCGRDYTDERYVVSLKDIMNDPEFYENNGFYAFDRQGLGRYIYADEFYEPDERFDDWRDHMKNDRPDTALKDGQPIMKGKKPMSKYNKFDKERFLADQKTRNKNYKREVLIKPKEKAEEKRMEQHCATDTWDSRVCKIYSPDMVQRGNGGLIRYQGNSYIISAHHVYEFLRTQGTGSAVFEFQTMQFMIKLDEIKFLVKKDTAVFKLPADIMPVKRHSKMWKIAKEAPTKGDHLLTATTRGMFTSIVRVFDREGNVNVEQEVNALNQKGDSGAPVIGKTSQIVGIHIQGASNIMKIQPIHDFPFNEVEDSVFRIPPAPTSD